MADNDYQVRLGRIKEFLTDNHKVRVTVRFTFRQMVHREFGYELLKKVVADTNEISKIDQEPKFLGRQLMMMLTPARSAKATARRVKGGKKSEETQSQDQKVSVPEN